MILGFLTIVLFMPGVFVEHDMATREWKSLKGNNSGTALPGPKWYTLVALMVVFFLMRVNITINER